MMRHLAVVIGLLLTHLLVVGAAEPEPGAFEGLVYYGGLQPERIGRARIEYRPLGAPPTERAGVVTSAKDGTFRVEGVTPGTYALRVSARGFETRTDASVVVVPGATTRIDLALEPAKGLANPAVQRIAALLVGGIVLILVMMRARIKSQRLLDDS